MGELTLHLTWESVELNLLVGMQMSLPRMQESMRADPVPPHKPCCQRKC